MVGGAGAWGGEEKLGPKRRDKSEKGFEKKGISPRATSERTMSSDEDAGTCQRHLQRPPCWRVVARARVCASREVKQRREESGSDEGAEEGRTRRVGRRGRARLIRVRLRVPCLSILTADLQK